MNVAHAPAELEPRPRAVAIGTFDGVHLGHRAVIAGATDSGLAPTVVTFHPHPREVLGYDVVHLSTLERRLELLAELGVRDTLVVEFTPELAALEPEAFATQYVLSLGTELVIAGEGFCFGAGRRGTMTTFAELGMQTQTVPLVPDVSSTRIRKLAAAGDVRTAASLLGRPVEVEGIVVSGDARGGTLGFPTANLRIDHSLLVPEYGIYAGAARDHRAAVSIGVNPHYGGAERRIEAFLLEFEGDLYGQRVVVELWDRLRDEAVFESEEALIAQIAADVAATRAATRP